MTHTLRLLRPIDLLLDLLLPTACAGCAAPGRLLCAGCRALLSGPAARIHPEPEPPGLPATVAVATYAGPVRSVLAAHKEHAVLGLTRPLGRSLAAALVAGSQPGLVVVPVPSSRRAVRARGHDPTLRLARSAARLLPAHPPVVRALRHVRPVADQAGLGRRDRADNLAGALGVRTGAVPSLAGRPVVVVDDVVTTGATLAEAARALTAVGAEVVGAAVVAATPLTGPRSFARPLAPPLSLD